MDSAPDKTVNAHTSVSHVASSTPRLNVTPIRQPTTKIQKGRSPIYVDELVRALKAYHGRPVAEKLENGLKNGFQIGYTGPRQEYRCTNLKSVAAHMEVAPKKVRTEVEADCVVGPFAEPPLPPPRVG